MNNKQTFLRIFFVLISFGIISLMTMLSRPTIAEIRAVDFVHLIGTGMCLGGAVVALGAYFRSRRSS